MMKELGEQQVPFKVEQRPQRRKARLRELFRAGLGELARGLRPRHYWGRRRAARELVCAPVRCLARAATVKNGTAFAAALRCVRFVAGGAEFVSLGDNLARGHRVSLFFDRLMIAMPLATAGDPASGNQWC